MRKYFLPVLWSVALFVSCGRHETSDSVLSCFDRIPLVRLVPEETIDLEEYGILDPVGIDCYDGALVIRKWKSENLVDILTPEGRLVHCIRKGNGPGELVDIGSLQVLGDTLLAYSPTQQKLLSIDLPATIASQRQFVAGERRIGMAERRISGQIALPFYLQCTRDGRTFGAGMFEGDCWYAEISDGGDIKNGVPGPRIDDERLSEAGKKVLNTASLLSVSPDGSRIAAAYTHIAAVSLGNTVPELHESWSELFYPPHLWFPDQPGLTVGYERDNPATFLGARAENDTVFLLYSGKVRGEDGEDRDHGSHLLGMDWDGHPRYRFELDVPIAAFCIDGSDLYGVSFFPSAKVCRFTIGN